MTKYGMTPPEGDDVYYDTPNWLMEKVLHAGPEFWNIGAGEAQIESHGNRILIVFHKTRGFVITFYEGEQLSGFFPRIQDELGDPIEVSIGGSPWFYPESVFVPRTTAWQIVKEFCDSGTRLPIVRWISEVELNWDGHKGKPAEPA